MNSKVLAVMNDLFFSVKINDAAKKLGSAAEFVKDADHAVERAKLHPPLIILDLNCNTLDPLAFIRNLKSDSETAAIPMLGFISHVQTELRKNAEAAGCDTVVARSAFAQNLSAMLQRYLARS
jgi:CheY-like chemotaxis protein